MEQNNPNWKKWLSKGAFAVSCIIVAALLLFGAVYVTLRVRRGCRSGSGYVSEATPTPEPTPLPDRVYSADKNPPAAPPLDKLDLTQGHLDEYSAFLSDATRWIDLTPDGAEGFTVIRSIDLGCSYVVENGEYYRLGEGEDGKGVVDVMITVKPSAPSGVRSIQRVTSDRYSEYSSRCPCEIPSLSGGGA